MLLSKSEYIPLSMMPVNTLVKPCPTKPPPGSITPIAPVTAPENEAIPTLRHASPALLTLPLDNSSPAFTIIVVDQTLY